ncbi:MAG TPA: hypothetical protein VJ771_06600 [Candidatus Nitrosotalea sp.]|nr:hypothetical protein [Candidatus Nitrosotalea sp.]
MGLSVKKIHGKDFLYYQEHGKSILIGPKGEYDKGNLDKINYALTHNDSRITKLLEKYVEETLELSLYMPEPERKEYLSKRSAELLARLRRLEPEVQKEMKKYNIVKKLESPAKIIKFDKLCSDILNLHSRILLVYVLNGEGKIVGEQTRKGVDDIIPRKGRYMDSIILDAVDIKFDSLTEYRFLPQNKIASFIFPFNEYHVLVMTKMPLHVQDVGGKIFELIKQEISVASQPLMTEADKLVKRQREIEEQISTMAETDLSKKHTPSPIEFLAMYLEKSEKSIVDDMIKKGYAIRTTSGSIVILNAKKLAEELLGNISEVKTSNKK